MAFCSVYILCVFINVAVGEVCRVNLRVLGEVSTDADLNKTNEDWNPQAATGLITCPGPDDPAEFTSCCYDTLDASVNQSSQYDTTSDVPKCCFTQDPSSLFFFISDQLALIIAICLTVTLLIITIIIVVCCFWSVCPLYMACRVRYRQDDIIAYASKDDETTNLNEMPPEEQKGIKIYSPNAMKITSLKEDA